MGDSKGDGSCSFEEVQEEEFLLALSRQPLEAVKALFSVVSNDKLSKLVTTPYNYKITQAVHGLATSIAFIKALNVEWQKLFAHNKAQTLELVSYKEDMENLRHKGQAKKLFPKMDFDSIMPVFLEIEEKGKDAEVHEAHAEGNLEISAEWGS
ncbi:unnamed protein product [Ilex paraguariensis]|uniref:Uncharacterized protein n=1 Tax=Ilex paraguariensis TaxID=185542 RepID=A0ABC8RML1_9AQUA